MTDITTTDKSNSGGYITVNNLGFKPDIITFSFNDTYKDGSIIYYVDLTVDFLYHNTNYVTISSWYGDDVFDIYAQRLDTGFKIQLWKYRLTDSGLQHGAWSGKTINYRAYKIT